MKIRLDKLLLQRGLAPSRERAQAMILAGRVLVDEQKEEKAGRAVEEAATLRILGEELKYVSRGGLKLEASLAHWKIDLPGKRCMDVGTSTGGFTDCMLQAGAQHVVAVDTGRGQIHAKLRSDARLTLLENVNARYLEREQVGAPVAFIAMDVSFISATLVLPAVVRSGFQGSSGELVVLVKPQFEAGRESIGKGGIVRDEYAQREAVSKVERCVADLGGRETEWIESPILGGEGNREFLLYARFKESK
jgi:23S rRNA (cytidine1920-2'-O)/16S rRNA (cytidine1409-2'-O)-methyltransferase